MKEFKITSNGETKYTALMPDGRHEVTLEQWNTAYPYLVETKEAEKLYEDGDIANAQIMLVKSMCGTMAALSENLEYDDLININFDKLNNLFLVQFSWLTNENPKKEFNINGKKFNVPNFETGSAGDFMDVMSLISALNDHEEADKGLAIAAIYMREGEYEQDVDKIMERKEFLKKHGRMDLFYSAAFFLRNSLRAHKANITVPLTLVLEVEKLASVLNGWATILYSLILLKLEYSQTQE